jgi:peptidoglycan hydrolase FlgJ
VSPISPVLSSGITLKPESDPASGRDPKKIRDAASQFEGLLIAQVFKTVHEDEGGWLGTGDDETASTAMGMADEYLAQSISKRGGLGLAQMIARQLEPADSASSSSSETDSPTPPTPAGIPRKDP